MKRKNKPGSGKCVHCCSHFDIRNWDHVIPVSWYPETTPQNIEKWKIPTCKKCNSDYGRLEEDMVALLTMTVERSNASRGIHEKVLRSITPSLARGKRDRKARESKRRRILAALIPGYEIPDHGTYPGLGERWGRSRGSAMGVEIPAEYFEKFSEKIVRGIHYLETNDLIEDPFKVSFYAADEDRAEPVSALLELHGKHYTRGPGFEIYRAVPEEDNRYSMFKIILFDTVVMYAAVDDES